MITVGELMTRNPVTAQRWDTAAEAARAMSLHDIGGLPVVDDGRLQGVLHGYDLIDRIADDAFRRDERVESLMDLEVLTVSADAPVSELAHRMQFEGSHRAFVLDDEHRLVGVITTWDLIGALHDEPHVRPRSS